MKKILCILIALLQSSFLFCEEPDRPYGLWRGYPIDSWVITRENVKFLGHEKKLYEKLIVKEKNRDAVLVEHYLSKTPTFKTKPTIEKPKVSAIEVSKMRGATLLQKTKEKLKVEDQVFYCDVSIYRLSKPDVNIEGQIEIWENSKVILPYRELELDGPDLALTSKVLKAKYTLQQGEMRQSMEVQVVSLSEEKSIGKKSVRCIREEGTFSKQIQNTHNQGELKRWLSDTIPGRVLLEIVEGQFENQKVERMKEVVDFGLKAQTKTKADKLPPGVQPY